MVSFSSGIDSGAAKAITAGLGGLENLESDLQKNQEAQQQDNGLGNTLLSGIYRTPKTLESAESSVEKALQTQALNEEIEFDKVIASISDRLGLPTLDQLQFETEQVINFANIYRSENGPKIGLYAENSEVKKVDLNDQAESLVQQVANNTNLDWSGETVEVVEVKGDHGYQYMMFSVETDGVRQTVSLNMNDGSYIHYSKATDSDDPPEQVSGQLPEPEESYPAQEHEATEALYRQDGTTEVQVFET